MIDELNPIRQGIFWALSGGFCFGVGERIFTTLQSPTAENLGLLTVSSLCFALFCFLKPRRVA